MVRKTRSRTLSNNSDEVICMTVGYIRLSVSNEEESSSIENQKHMIERWGIEHHALISQYYVDNGYSGSSFERPAFQQMLQDVESNKIWNLSVSYGG